MRFTTLLDLHARAFAELGGVPATVRPDKARTAVMRAAFRVDTLCDLDRSYRELAMFYGFKVEPTPPGPARKARAGVRPARPTSSPPSWRSPRCTTAAQPVSRRGNLFAMKHMAIAAQRMRCRLPGRASATAVALLVAACAPVSYDWDEECLRRAEEREQTLGATRSSVVSGLPLRAYVAARTAFLVECEEPTTESWSRSSAAAITTDGYFLTASHCLRPNWLIIRRGADKDFAPLRVVWRSDDDAEEAVDLAIVHAAVHVDSAFEWTADAAGVRGDPVVGGGVAYLGSDEGPSFWGGKILGRVEIAVRSGNGERPWIVIAHDGPIAMGDSGGPLTDMRGRLLAISISHLPPGKSWCGFAAPCAFAVRPDVTFIASRIEEDRRRRP